MPGRLVFDLPAEFAHADISDCTGQGVIPGHALDVQILQHNHIGAFNDGRGGLVQEIGALCGDIVISSFFILRNF
jgi:hypothetical protein